MVDLHHVGGLAAGIEGLQVATPCTPPHKVLADELQLPVAAAASTPVKHPTNHWSLTPPASSGTASGERFLALTGTPAANIGSRDQSTAAAAATPKPSSLQPSTSKPQAAAPIAASQWKSPSRFISITLHIAKRRSAAASRPVAMADFLASFSFASETPAPAQRGLGSIDELQSILRDALGAKVTETRAEHVSLTEEFKSTVELSLTVSEHENDALQGLNNIDPVMGGARSESVSADPSGQTLRVVKVQEALMNQNDNPVLQRTVAKHIMGAMSVADGSSWVLRDMSRVKQDWTFTYICKDSLQHWSRQHSKTPALAVVGEYSLKEPDPVLMGMSKLVALGR